MSCRLDIDEVPPELEQGEESHEDSAPEIITMPSRFDQVQEKGYIDVWWLYDDGGIIRFCKPNKDHSMLVLPCAYNSVSLF